MEIHEIDANLYNEKSLYLLNIRELRDMGRKFGVPSPTTLKKQQLVEYILNVVYGKIEPPIRNSFGRPNSREFDMNKFVEKIKKNANQADELKEYRLSGCSDLKFKAAAYKEKQCDFVLEQRVVYKDDKICSLRIRQFIEADSDILVDKTTASSLGLENFDVVEIINTNSGIKIVTKNGEKVAAKINPITIEGENIKAGTRKVFHIRTKEKINESIKQIIEKATLDGVKIAYFGRVFKENAQNVIISGDEKEQFKQLMMFIEGIKKLVYENQDIIAIIEDKNDVEAIVDSLEDDFSERLKIHLNQEIEDYLKLGNAIISFNELKAKSYFN